VKADTPSPVTESGHGALWLAFVWGLAEATFFFVVPDVLTSRLVLQKPRVGFAACFSSLAGALLGGMVLYHLGRDPSTQTQLAQAMDWIPGITPGLIGKAKEALMHEGLLPALFTGVLAGIPYKLYALQAAGAGMGLVTFLSVSCFARLARFLLVTGMAWFVGAKLLPNLSKAMTLRIHAGGWILFYVFYFWRMSL
jgi:membrane protein YqaA with SNARE-associated domain